ncbi:MAG: type II toxin-antitoxin system PemK/MazF family toxin, partial [Desulfobacula sp.]|nr:type II toxin-antitoxin system PemK/MazF family toxin [Desulfobacula sp.]
RPVIQFKGKKARILLDQIRSVDKVRLGKKMGEIPEHIWHSILLDMLE